MAKQTKGFCKYCGKEYTRGGMLRHLVACKERGKSLEMEKGKTRCGYFELVLTDKYNPDYWLIVEVKETASLEDLDSFIRAIWVECCGHLSAFEIDRVQYDKYPAEDYFWGEPSESMKHQLKNVLEVGQSFTYEYDFGSTTDLKIKVHDYRQGKGRREKIILLSRNNPPEILCSQCGKNKAEWIDPENYYEEAPFWCEECLRKEHEEACAEEEFDEEDGFCEEDVYGDYIPDHFLPVCNSPRMGVCAYEGSEVYPDQFVPDKKEK